VTILRTNSSNYRPNAAFQFGSVRAFIHKKEFSFWVTPPDPVVYRGYTYCNNASDYWTNGLYRTPNPIPIVR